MTDFVYLFRSNPSVYQSMSPEQMQQTMKMWMDWMDSLEKKGHLKMPGQRLDGNGRVIRGKLKTVTDGPYIETKDFVQGYMIVKAGHLDEAMELAKGCPVLESDGTVEIRPFLTQ